MTSKYELEYLLNSLINNVAKIERLKHKDNNESTLNKVTINRLWNKVYTIRHKIIKLFDIECIENNIIEYR